MALAYSAPALVVSLSNFRDDTLLESARFLAAMHQRNIQPSLLVAPHAGKEWSLRRSPAALDWIHHRKAEGAEILLAGFDQSVRGRAPEFASLDQHEARLRLTAATRQMDALDLSTDMFAPPKWTMSAATLEVLPDLGFRIAAGRNSVHDVTTGAVDPTRVLAFGEGFGAARWWRKAVRASVSRTVHAGGSIRLSVSATRLRDLTIREDLLRIVDDALVAGARPAGYAHVPLSSTVNEGASATSPTASAS